MKKAVLATFALLLPLSPLVLHARTTATFGQSEVGQPCGRLAHSTDFDTLVQCTSSASDMSSGIKQTAPIILGTLTAPPYANTTCDSGKAGMLQWTGTSFQACGGTSWGSLAAGGALDDLTDAKTDYASLYNVFLGSGAGNAVTTGGYNTALGYNALQAATVGGRNTAIGYNALNATVTGSYNTALGTNAGAALTTGTYNTMIGNGVGHTGLTTGSRNILIGTSSAVTTPAVGTNDWLNIGNTIYGNLSTGSIALGAAAVTIGSTIDTSARTDSIILPKGTDAQRPSGVTGMVRYNTTSNCLESYQGGTPAWLCVGAANLGASAAAASPYRTGQVNTGLFSPATGVVSVTTLGTERLRVDANGAVKIGAGAVTAGSILELSAGTGTAKSSMILPKDTTANRPTTATAGMVRFNTTTNDFEGYDGTDWVAFSSPGSGEIGEVKIWPAGVVPAGYLECNGAAVSRTTYAALFAVIGTTYGAGDGSTTFNLPDYRGEFIRGWANGSANDPDAASRTNRGDGTAGDAVGTKQTGQNVSHAHDVNPPATASDSVADHAHTIDPPSTASNTVANHAHDIDPPSTASNTVANHSHGIDPPATASDNEANHAHGIDPPATDSGYQSANHLHSINPPSETIDSSGTHTHTVPLSIYSSDNVAAGSSVRGIHNNNTSTGGSQGAHTHVVDIPAFDSGYNTSSHYHTTNIGLFASATAGGHGHSTDIALFTSATAGGHGHTVDIGSFESTATGGHGHTTDIASFASTSTGGHGHTTDIASFASTATGGSETRPRNVNVMFIIRHQEEPAAVGSVGALTPQAFALSGDATSTPVLFDGTAPVTMVATVGKIQGRSVATTAPFNGETLVWNTASSMWQPGSSSMSTLGASTASTSPYRVGEINTGLYSPATGSVGVVSAGTEIMRVTASGVGIGTTDPNNALHVESGGINAAGVISYNSENRIGLGRISSLPSNDNGAYVGWLDSTAGYTAGSLGLIARSSAAGNIALLTGTGTPVERMRVTDTGNVGIGTTNPLKRLHVVSEVLVSGPSARFSIGDSGGADPATTKTWHLDNTASDLRFFQQPNATTAGTTYMTLKDSGDLELLKNARIPSENSSLSFGSDTRQMLNLYSTTYGLGVQDNTLYFRTGNSFGWHKLGVHSDTDNDPGTGGVNLMHLGGAALTVNVLGDFNSGIEVQGVQGSLAPFIQFHRPLEEFAHIRYGTDTANNGAFYMLRNNQSSYATVIGAEFISHTGTGNFRMVAGDVGSFFRNDGTTTHLLLTNSGDPYGGWNTLRPFSVVNSTGNVVMAHNLTVSGALTTGGTLAVGGSVYGGNGYRTRTGHSGSYGTNWFNLYWNGSAMRLYADNVDLGSITTSSDYRLKHDVKDVQSGLDRIMKLHPISYRWKNVSIFKDDGQRHEGFLAHEVQNVIPSAASGKKDDLDKEGKPTYQSINMPAIVAVLTKAVQELANKVTAIEEKVSSLLSFESRITTLAAENKELKARLKAIEDRLSQKP